MVFTKELEGLAKVEGLKGFSKAEPSLASEKIVFQVSAYDDTIATKFALLLRFENRSI